MSSFPPSPPRKLPVIDGQTGFFWTAGADGRLLIQRCVQCGRYQHPPQPVCGACHTETVAPEPVSGRGRVKSFTVNHQRWLPGLDDPYVFAVVELAEQDELYVFTNILAPPETVRSGMPVAVAFEPHGEVWLPMFRPDAEATA